MRTPIVIGMAGLAAVLSNLSPAKADDVNIPSYNQQTAIVEQAATTNSSLYTLFISDPLLGTNLFPVESYINTISANAAFLSDATGFSDEAVMKAIENYNSATSLAGNGPVTDAEKDAVLNAATDAGSAYWRFATQINAIQDLLRGFNRGGENVIPGGLEGIASSVGAGINENSHERKLAQRYADALQEIGKIPDDVPLAHQFTSEGGINTIISTNGQGLKSVNEIKDNQTYTLVQYKDNHGWLAMYVVGDINRFVNEAEQSGYFGTSIEDISHDAGHNVVKALANPLKAIFGGLKHKKHDYYEGSEQVFTTQVAVERLFHDAADYQAMLKQYSDLGIDTTLAKDRVIDDYLGGANLRIYERDAHNGLYLAYAGNMGIGDSLNVIYGTDGKVRAILVGYNVVVDKDLGGLGGALINVVAAVNLLTPDKPIEIIPPNNGGAGGDGGNGIDPGIIPPSLPPIGGGAGGSGGNAF